MARNLRVMIRNGPTMAFTLFQPVIWMVLFAQNFERLADYPEFAQLGYSSYLTFFVPSVMVLTVLNSATLSGMSMVADMNSGVLAKFVISPISRSSILLGRVFADGVSMVGQVLVVLAVAYLMGAEAATGLGGVVTVLALTVLLGMCAAIFSNFVALHTGNAQLTMLIGAVSAVPLLLLSPAFFPEQLQTAWLRTVENFNPVAYVITAGQNLLNLELRGGQLLATLGVLALTGLLFSLATIREFRRATSGTGRPQSAGLMGLLMKLHQMRAGHGRPAQQPSLAAAGSTAGSADASG
jgi:ABC-2 type transport system permease protein